METLTVEAASLESAREVEAALRGFERELVADDGGYCVQVTLPTGAQAIVGVLHALNEYVRVRGTTARINLDGRTYALEAPALDT